MSRFKALFIRYLQRKGALTLERLYLENLVSKMLLGLNLAIHLKLGLPVNKRPESDTEA